MKYFLWGLVLFLVSCQSAQALMARSPSFAGDSDIILPAIAPIEQTQDDTNYAARLAEHERQQQEREQKMVHDGRIVLMVIAAFSFGIIGSSYWLLRRRLFLVAISTAIVWIALLEFTFDYLAHGLGFILKPALYIPINATTNFLASVLVLAIPAYLLFLIGYGLVVVVKKFRSRPH